MLNPIPEESNLELRSWPKSAVSCAVSQGHVEVLKIFYDIIGPNAFVTDHILESISVRGKESFHFLVSTVFPWYLPSTAPSHPLNVRQRQAISRLHDLIAIAMVRSPVWYILHVLLVEMNMWIFAPEKNYADLRVRWKGNTEHWLQFNERGIVGKFLNYSMDELEILVEEVDSGPAFGQLSVPLVHYDNFWYACKEGNLSLVKAMYRRGANLFRFRCDPPESALMYAAESGSIALVKWLLSKGCSPLYPFAIPIDGERGYLYTPQIVALLKPLMSA